MKNAATIFFFFLLLITLSIPAAAQSKSKLTGNWTGILYQNTSPGALAAEYKFSMKIEELNGIVKGVSTIMTGPHYGVLDFKGTFKKDTLIVEEYLIEKEKITGAQWCYKKGAMRLKTDGKKLILEGNWTGYVMDNHTKVECSPGRIVLTKEQGFISLKGHVVNEKTIKAIPADIRIVHKKTGRQVALVKSPSGEFDIALPGSNEYELTVEASGYHTRYEYVTLVQSKILNITLTPIEVGQTIPIPHVYFEQSTSVITKESSPALDRLFKFMTLNPTVHIELQGHTSNEGDAAKNIVLSQQRVKAIKDLLLQKGIVSTRIDLKGLGAANPLVPNDTEEHRKQNRRVDFVVLTK